MAKMLKAEAASGGTGHQGAVGKVVILYGTVKAISPDGTVRVMGPNSLVFANDKIITESDGSVSIILEGMPPIHLDLGRMSQIVLDQDVLSGPGTPADALAEADKVQQALLAGEQPIEPEAPAAGGEASSGGGHPTVAYDLTGAEVTPDSGAETRGIGFAPLENVQYDSVPIGGDDIGAVDDEGLCEGNLGGDQSDDPTNDAFIVGKLSYNFGSDGPHQTEPFVWSMAGLPEMGITSHGNTLLYEVVDGGLTLNAYYMGYPANGAYKTASFNEIQPEKVYVFSMELTNVETGAYKFTLFEPLDHATPGTEDDINYIFGYELKDGDNSTGNGVLRMTVDDDTPIMRDASESRTVDEDDILTCSSQGTSPNDGACHDGSFTGNPGHPFDHGPANITGSLAALVSFGADGPDDDPMTFGPDGFSFAHDLTGLPALTSNSEAVTYRLDGNTLHAECGTRTIFTLELDSDGHYKFSLYDQLDHTYGDNIQGSLPIDLSGVIVATDFDGDPVTLTEGKFVINITDDVPSCAICDMAVVEDEAMDDGNKEVWDSVFGVPLKLSGSASGTIEDNALWGADEFAGAKGFTVDGQSFDPGTTVYWDQYGNFLGTNKPEEGNDSSDTFKIDNIESSEQMEPAAALIVNADGTYTFALLNNMLMGYGEQGEQTDCLAKVTITGQDGDGDTRDVDVWLKVDDDVPSIDVKAANEAAVILTTQDAETIGPDFDTATSEANFSGVFSFSASYGADGQGSVTPLSYELNIGLGYNKYVGASGLECDGDKVYLFKIGNDIIGSTAWKQSDVNDGNKVFQLSVEGDGKVTLTQYKEIDHDNNHDTSAPYDDQYEVMGSGILGLGLVTLTATATITDGDGDHDTDCATIDLGGNIRFADDGPAVLVNAIVYLDDETAKTTYAAPNPGGDGDYDGLTPPPALTGTLGHEYGADGAGKTLLTGTDTLPAGFSSAITDGGKTLTISQYQGSSWVKVIEVKLANSTDGNYEVKYLKPIVHSNSGTTEENLEFTVKYKVTDGDYDTAAGTLKINVDDDTPTALDNAMVNLDDETALVTYAAPNMGGTDDYDGAVPAPNTTGTLAHSYGADGAGSTLLTGTETLPAGFSSAITNGGTHLTISQMQNGQSVEVLKVTLSDTTSGNYIVDQLNPIFHPTPQVSEEERNFTIKYEVTDGDGDKVQSNLNIKVDDDTPEGGDVFNEAQEDSAQNTNLMIILDLSGSMDDNPDGPGGFATRLDVAKDAIAKLIADYDDLGDVMVRIVTFSSDSNPNSVSAAWMTATDALNYINGLSDYAGSGNTDYDAAIAAAQTAFASSGRIPDGKNVAYFLSDGEPNETNGTGSVGIVGTEETNWQNFLKANDIVCYALGMGSGSDINYLKPIAYNGVTEVNDDANLAIVVDDITDLPDVLSGTVGGSTTGNLLTDSSFGADGAGALKIVSISHDADGNPGTPDVVYNTCSPGYDAATKILTVTTHLGGTLTVNFATGDYSYKAPSVTDDSQEMFGFTIQDADGDPASAKLTIDVIAADDAPTAKDNYAAGDEGTAGETANLVLVIDSSGSINGSELNLMKAAVTNLINDYGSNLVKVMLVDFDDSATVLKSGGQVWMTGDQAIAKLSSIGSGGNTDYDDAIAAVQNNYGTPPDADNTFVYFLSDGEPTGSDGWLWWSNPNEISTSERQSWVDFLEDKGIDEVYAVGVGMGSGGEAALNTVAWSSTGNHAANVFEIDSYDDLEATLSGTVPQPVKGNVITDNDTLGGGADEPGADGWASPNLLVSVEYNGSIHNFIDADDSVTFNLINSGGKVTIEGDGDYTFTPGTDVTGDKTDIVKYSIEDSNGTTDSADLILTTTDLDSLVGGDPT